MNRARRILQEIVTEDGSQSSLFTPGTRIAYGSGEYTILGSKNGMVFLRANKQSPPQQIQFDKLMAAFTNGKARQVAYQLDSLKEDLNEMTSVGAIPAREQPMGIVGPTGKKLDYAERLRRLKQRRDPDNILPATESLQEMTFTSKGRRVRHPEHGRGTVTRMLGRNQDDGMSIKLDTGKRKRVRFSGDENPGGWRSFVRGTKKA